RTPTCRICAQQPILRRYPTNTASSIFGGGLPALLERQDCTFVAWYPSLYAPRAGGAHDSHHRTAGVASRTRRRGGSVAARGARPTADDAGRRISRSHIG